MKPTSASPGHPPSHEASAGRHSLGGGGHHTPDEMQNDDVAHEHSDVNIPVLIWSAVILTTVVAVTAGLMLLLFNVLEGQAKARDPKLSPLAMPTTTMPATTNASPFFGGALEPKLMTNEPFNLKDVRTLEQQQLHGYGWVDEKAGVARISIDRAKELTLERGLPVRPDPVTDPRLGTRTPATGESSSGRNITRTLVPAAAGAAPTPAPAATGHEVPHKGGN